MQENILLFLSLSGLFLSHHDSLPTSQGYYYVDQLLTWTDAQQYCRERNGDLATIDNALDVQSLQKLQEAAGIDYGHVSIGLYDDRTSWKWSLGNQDYKIDQNYGMWTNGEPDFHNSAQNYKEPHYIYYPNNVTWYEALQYCRTHYTDLVSIRNATEGSKILALYGGQTWIGLHRDPWSHWSDGSRFTFSNWAAGEPNNYGGEVSPRCGNILVTSGKFFDHECGLRINFACQGSLKQRSILKLRISSEADMTDPEVGRQVLEQLYGILAKAGETRNISWLVKDGQVFHRDQPSHT